MKSLNNNSCSPRVFAKVCSSHQRLCDTWQYIKRRTEIIKTKILFGIEKKEDSKSIAYSGPFFTSVTCHVCYVVPADQPPAMQDEPQCTLL